MPHFSPTGQGHIASNVAEVAVSVIVAVRNGAKTIQDCLDSVAAQRGVRLELVVIDGASTDGTASILGRNAAQIASWCSEPDDGIYAAWNKGLRRARGEWICFLGCDDTFHDAETLHSLVSAAQDARACRIVYGKMKLMTTEGRVAETVGQPWRESRQAFLDGFMIPHPGTLHHRSVFEHLGGFDEDYQIAGDYELLLRVLRDEQPLFVDRVVVNMRLGGKSVRPQTIHRALQEVRRARRKHGLRDTPGRLTRALIAARIGAIVHRLLGDAVFAWLADLYRAIRGRPRIWTV